MGFGLLVSLVCQFDKSYKFARFNNFAFLLF